MPWCALAPNGPLLFQSTHAYFRVMGGKAREPDFLGIDSARIDGEFLHLVETKNPKEQREWIASLRGATL